MNYNQRTYFLVTKHGFSSKYIDYPYKDLTTRQKNLLKKHKIITKDILDIPDRPMARIRDIFNYMMDNYDMSPSTLKRISATLTWKQDSLGRYVEKEELDKLGMSNWKKRQVMIMKQRMWY